MATPFITSFGDDDHAAGETGLTIDGQHFGEVFEGEVWMFANADRSGAQDQLTVTGWTDRQITGVAIPASPTNANGTVYLAVRQLNGEWSSPAFPYAFTLSGAAGAPATGSAGGFSWAAVGAQGGVYVPLTAGRISGTGTLVCEQPRVGGFLLSSDGTNSGTWTIRKNNATGAILFEQTGKSPLAAFTAIELEDTSVLYYSVSGTGAGVMLYGQSR